MVINQYPSFCLYYSTALKHININKQVKFDMTDFQLANQFMITSSITQPAPSSHPSSNLWRKQTRISGLDTSHRNISITPE